MDKKLLLVEDDDALRKVIGNYFRAKDFIVKEADNGNSAIALSKSEAFDILLLDIMLPDMDGYTICRKIRSTLDVPIIFITAKYQEQDKLNGYDVGADDYITKPFSLPVLHAKVLALLKRVDGMLPSGIISACGISVDLSAGSVKVDGQTIKMAPKEYDLLVLLMKNKGKILTRERILNALWCDDIEVYDRTVDSHIKKLRKVLGDRAQCVATVVKGGYKFDENIV